MLLGRHYEVLAAYVDITSNNFNLSRAKEQPLFEDFFAACFAPHLRCGREPCFWLLRVR